MSKSLLDALNHDAWSVSAVVFDLNDMLDDEGRPVSERRADAVVRANIEMEMRLCPYSGARNNKWMNYSALVQISNYFNPVTADMAAFRRQRAGADVTWDDIHAGIIDLLARPAIHLLQKRSAEGPVPAQCAVSHKLAAGFFGVLRNLHERIAMGATLPVSVDSFMQLVDETNALVGSTEVCAGSLPMIRKACIALIEGNSESTVELDPIRLEIARCLALQVQLGIFWDLYDRVHLWSLLHGEHRQHLKPFNAFLARKIEETANTVDNSPPARPHVAALPEKLTENARSLIAAALLDNATPEQLEEDRLAALALLNEPGSVIQYQGDKTGMAKIASGYLHTMRAFKTELSSLELELRRLLGYAEAVPIRFGTAAFPAPQAQHWYELILGRRLGVEGRLTGNSTGIRTSTTNKY